MKTSPAIIRAKALLADAVPSDYTDRAQYRSELLAVQAALALFDAPAPVKDAVDARLAAVAGVTTRSAPRLYGSLWGDLRYRFGKCHRCSSVLLAGEAVVVLRYPDDGRARGLECSACSSNHKEG